MGAVGGVVIPILGFMSKSSYGRGSTTGRGGKFFAFGFFTMRILCWGKMS